MFSLVQFDNLEYKVLLSKRVKVNEGSNCTVKYKTGGKYNAELIKTSDNSSNLEAEKAKLENFGQGISSSTPNSSLLEKSNQQLINISLTNLTFTLNSASEAPSGLGPNWPDGNSVDNIENSSNNVSDITKSVENVPNRQHDLYENRDHLNDSEHRRLYVNNTLTANGSISAMTENDSCKTNQDHLNDSEPARLIVNNTFSANGSISANAEDDSSYHPEQSTENRTKEMSSTVQDCSIIEKSSIINERNLVNVQQLTVPVSKCGIGQSKRHFCLFCKTLQTKFARHLLLKHKTEEAVKKFMYLPRKNVERLQLINTLRKKGDRMHNEKPEYNSGILIVSRQRQVKSKNTAEDYLRCRFCDAYFAKATIRFHIAKCDKNRRKGQRNIQCTSRRATGNIHSAADPILRDVVFPILTDDDVVRAIKYDELIIKFGNKLCERYSLRHQHDYIRTQLRMLGRVKLEMMKQDNNIREFEDIFQPEHFDQCVKCIRTLAEWDESSGTFKVPFNAQFVSTLMKKCAKKFRIECIKRYDDDKKKMVDDFLLVWEEDIPSLVGKKAHNDQMDKRREKKLVLPTKEDIKLLYDYLKNECCKCLEDLNTEFDLNTYKLLTKCTLIFVQIFNRRRAGEIERLTLTNYENKEVINDNIDKELYQKLSDATKQFAQQFTRIVIKGKLERTVPVLLSPLAVKCIETLLKYRTQAGASNDNEFIFCSLNPNKISKQYLRACPLLKSFANQCGAVLPSTLRGTQLRKHVATYTSMLNLEDCQVDRLANFMGHHKDIHKSIYRVPVPVAEITDVSKLLMAAIGEDDENGKESDDNQNSDSSSDEDTPFQPQYKSKIRVKRKLSSVSKIRAKWSDQEKKAVTKYFGKLNELPKLPSLSECKTVITKFKVLENRTPQHIFAYINNERRRC